MARPAIYLDSLFVINMAVDYLLLLAAARSSACPFRRSRLVWGAGLGALYAAASVLPGMEFLQGMPLKALVAAAMTVIAFGAGKGYLRRMAVFLGLSFLLGGFLIAVNLLYGYLPGMPLYVSIRALPLILLTAGFYLLISIFFRASAQVGQSTVIEAEVRLESRRACFTALVDTGNTLRDPVSQIPVMVAEFEAVRCVLPEGLSITAETLSDPAGILERASKAGVERLFRLVPYKSVGTEQGMLLAVRPDAVTLAGVRQKPMLVALLPSGLSNQYSALVGQYEKKGAKKHGTENKDKIGKPEDQKAVCAPSGKVGNPAARGGVLHRRQ